MSLTTIIPKVRENKPYRLRCRFKVDPFTPRSAALISQAATVAERFVRDMHLQGWEHVAGGKWQLNGPFAPVRPVTIRPQRRLSAREMLPYVANGHRFLDKGDDTASIVRPLIEHDYWEYELAGVFYRPEILIERPDAHEEDNS